MTRKKHLTITRKNRRTIKRNKRKPKRKVKGKQKGGMNKFRPINPRPPPLPKAAMKALGLDPL